MSKKKPPLPTMEDIISFLNENPGKVGKKEIARAFHVRGDDRVGLKQMLKEMKSSGKIERTGHKKVMLADGLPEMCPSEITGVDSDGELIARPIEWFKSTPAPQILITDLGRLKPPPKEGDMVLLKLKAAGKKLFHGAVVRRLSAKPNRVVGLYDTTSGKGGRILSVDRRLHQEYFVDKENAAEAKNGDLIIADVLGSALHENKRGSRQAKIIQVLGNANAPKAASLIAVHLHGIPTEFSEQSIKAAQKAKLPPLGNRVDLRDMPLVTVDGEDARDFDDAVFAEPDENEKNKGGWHLVVAIADVACFVRPHEALDRDARERGNSVYFPDRVVPMLPMELSSDLCSLKPDQDRPCIAAHIWIDKNGKILRHKFIRAMMRSAARLNYNEVQAVFDGNMPEMNPALRVHLMDLYEAYKIMAKAREKRGALEIDVPEREITLSDAGQIEKIAPRERFESHKMIEEFMIAANVSAAEALESKNMPAMYRIHDAPSMEKVAALQTFLNTLHIKTIKRDKPHTDDFNKILDQVKGTSKSFMVNELVLRTQSQAKYSPENIGHFGLALEKYAHFTSPIRRYADLLVHRALISAYKLGEDGLRDEDGDILDNFEDLGEHLSATERRAAAAERDAEERYLSAYLADRIGEKFSALINGVSRFGLFVVLDETGAEGLIPISTLPGDYYEYEEDQHRLYGTSSGQTYTLGEHVDVILAEAAPVTGGLRFHLLDAGQKKLKSLNQPHKNGFKGRKKKYSKEFNKDKKKKRK